MWIAVKDEPDGDHSYDHQPPAAGPFDTFDEARDWIDGDERFTAVERG